MNRNLRHRVIALSLAAGTLSSCSGSSGSASILDPALEDPLILNNLFDRNVHCLTACNDTADCPTGAGLTCDNVDNLCRP